jgi:hypothetical protein
LPPDTTDPLVVAYRRELAQAGALDTAGGAVTLLLARYLAVARAGSVCAALSRELRASYLAATKGRSPGLDPLDELARRRSRIRERHDPGQGRW